MPNSNKVDGFTLVELVVVVLLLGILAAVALPRFTSLTSEAHIAALDGLKGALNSGVALVRAEASIKGVEDRFSFYWDMDEDGTPDLPLHHGHPGVWDSCARFVRGLPYWLQIDIPTSCSGRQAVGKDWRAVLDWNTFHFMPTEFESVSENCYVSYREASSSGDDGLVRGTPLASSRVTMTTSGC